MNSLNRIDCRLLTADKTAKVLLEGTGLSDYKVSFLAQALNDLAELGEHSGKTNRITCLQCAYNLTQMNRQHKNSIIPVVHFLTLISFIVLWSGSNGDYHFRIENFEQLQDLRFPTDFDVLYHSAEWGSDTHREYLYSMIGQYKKYKVISP